MDKYIQCLENTLDSIKWQGLHPQPPHYVFTFQDNRVKENFEEGYPLDEIFQEFNTGIKTHRDHFVIDQNEDTLRKRISDFRNLEIPDESIKEKYNLKSNKDWKLHEKRQSVLNDQDSLLSKTDYDVGPSRGIE